MLATFRVENPAISKSPTYPLRKRNTASPHLRAKPRGTKGNTLGPAKRPQALLGTEGGSGKVMQPVAQKPPTHKCDLPARPSQVARTKSEYRPAQSPDSAPSGRSSGLGR